MRKVIKIFYLCSFAFLLAACQFEDDNCPDDSKKNVAANYINLTIAVSNGAERGTRADADNIPLAGEDGNGREVGFERENAVTGITLILYPEVSEDANDPVLALVRYFPVKRVELKNQGTSYEPGTGDNKHPEQFEAQYTTGPQFIGKDRSIGLDMNKKYHAVIVANYDLTDDLKEGISTWSKAREMALEIIASGSPVELAHNYVNFIMSSEEDYIIDFVNDGVVKNTDGTIRKLTDQGKDILYDLTNKPLIIERLAARIDFWAKGATYQTKNGGGNGSGTYDKPGYVYTPVKADGTTKSNDRFVLTHITPFNLNNRTSYLLKHMSDGLLKPETGSNYVIDPATSSKTTSTLGAYASPLDDIATEWASSSWTGNDFSHTVADMHAQVGTGKTGGFSYTESNATAEDIIIGYPMENTLPDGSPLYYYATGIAIEGDYYTEDDVNKKEHRVYFTYIRHQGEKSTAYDALLPSELSKETKTSNNNPMNFGIVRNNIYRIYIDKVYEKDQTPRITLQIKVKKWDKFEHAPIYM